MISDLSDPAVWAQRNVTGHWTTLITPFTDQDMIDEDGLRDNVSRVLDIGADGVTYNWGTGEYWSLTVSERESICEIVEDAVGSRVLTGCHIGCESLKETIRLGKHAEKTGADLLILTPPSTAVKTEQQVLEYVENVAESVTHGVAYTNRSKNFASVNLSTDAVDQLVDLENVCVVKESHTDYLRAIRTFERVGNRAVVSTPHDVFFLLAPYYDISPQVCFANANDALFDSPDRTPYRDFINVAIEGDVEEMKELYTQQILPMKTIYDTWWTRIQEKYENIFPICTIAKPWLEIRGMNAGSVRPPLPSLSQDEKEELRGDLYSVGLANGFR